MSKILDDNNSENAIEEFLFEYSLFLLTSARGAVDEPHLYGSMRLLDGISRLTELYSKSKKIKPDDFLLEANSEIKANLDTIMKSDEEFVRFIDSLLVKFTDEMKKRYTRHQK
ncbi:MAG: DUF6092 family protein [Thaumarchaeota archaeon]|nr:DUF6092 family protein [Nitrososphaerota archaeon]